MNAGVASHLLALVVYAGGAFAGLLVYQVGGGILRWITPFWWGRQGWGPLLLAAIAIAIAAIPCFLITRTLLHRAWVARLPRRYELAALLAAGMTQGFLLWPIADWLPRHLRGLRTSGGDDFIFKVTALFALASVLGALIAAATGAAACYFAARLRGRL